MNADYKITFDPNITLLALREEDLPWALAHRNTDHVRLKCRDTHMIAYDEHFKWFKKLASKNKQAFRIDMKTKKIGMFILSHYEKRPGSIDFSLWIKEDDSRRGYGKRAIKSMIKYVESKNYHEITAQVIGDNIPSLATFLKCGFMIESHMNVELPNRPGKTAIFNMVRQLD